MTQQAMECGCEIVYFDAGTNRNDYIRYCPEHANSPALVAQLRAIIKEAKIGIGAGSESLDANLPFECQRKKDETRELKNLVESLQQGAATDREVFKQLRAELESARDETAQEIEAHTQLTLKLIAATAENERLKSNKCTCEDYTYGVCGTRQLQAQVESLTAERDALKVDSFTTFSGHLATHLDNASYFGCLTGDCPHETQSECNAAIKTWVVERINEGDKAEEQNTTLKAHAEALHSMLEECKFYLPEQSSTNIKSRVWALIANYEKERASS